MTASNTNLQQFIADEVARVKGVFYPVRAGRLERGLVRKVKCGKLYPNPNDEFCFPEIGPNEEIVSRYEKAFRTIREDPDASRFLDSGAGEPLDVQKIHPDGYMILNGHHRWIAAVRAGIDRLPVRIINLTEEKEIRRILENSKHDRRITLDMDEIVFSTDRDGGMEKPLRFPLNRIYQERLRLGIPALFAYFVSGGYDIWLYSSGYKSVDYIGELLKLHHTQVTGIITGTARKASKDAKTSETLEKLMVGKYDQTIHIDNDTVVCIDSREGTFREIQLPGAAAWTAEVMEAVPVHSNLVPR